MTTIRLSLLFQFLAMSIAFGGSISFKDLRCEYRTSPVGIETVQPRLSWVIESKDRGVMQSAYQVLVASSRENLRKEKGDLWDSGKVTSDQSIQVVYAGAKPDSAQTCFWKVRVWDQNGKVSGWSDPAEWTMGILNESDWKARWIGYVPDAQIGAEGRLREILKPDGLSWVWLNGSAYGDLPPGKAYFRKEIDLPAGDPVLEATFLFTADDGALLFVNGKQAGNEHVNWKAFTTRRVVESLKPGRNVLAFETRNTGKNPAGLIGRLGIVLQSGRVLNVPIDATWLASESASSDWNTAATLAQDWKPATELVPYGEQHWGKIQHFRIDPAPMFRKTFTISKSVRRATIFASALGVYELHLNGKPVDRDVFSPGWTDYKKRVHYIGYDVTEQLRRGENAIGAVLGDGWYAGYLVFTGRRNYYGPATRLLAQLHVEYSDGSKEVIGTDGSWKASTGPVREADMQMGCVYDARFEQKGWNKTGFKDGHWTSARIDETVEANLVAHPGEPIRRIEEIKAIKVTEAKPGVYVFDLGQNMVGWTRIRVKGRAGERITVRHAEMLNPDGTIYTTNLRRAAAIDVFLPADDSRREFEPSFTFHGFQYVEITGLDYKPSPADVIGVVVHSDLPRAGWFECSEPLVNKLTLNSLWGQKGNFLDVPTDCPQRDERAGWTGDAQVFMKTACFNMDSPAFYTKWLADLCEDSQDAKGGFGAVAPMLDILQYGDTGWADAGPVCVWRMYEMYGDRRALERHYASLLRYMDFLKGTSRDFVRGTGQYGDWLRLTGPQHSEAIGTAYYFYTATVMEKIARTLGKSDDVAMFQELSRNIRQAFVQKFIKPDGQILDDKNQTGQTFYALAFGLDLVPKEMKAKVAEQFVASIRKENDHLATGFLGTPFVLFALQNAGQTELAYKLVLNKTYPSWLQQVIWGSTTMWERWDGWRPDKGFQDPGMNSFNHYWLGCVSEWLFTQVAGIDTDGPAFKRIVIRPDIIDAEKSFSWVNARYDSIHGTISSRWKLEGNSFRLEVKIPANTTGTVHIPAAELATVTEGNKPLNRVNGLKLLGFEQGRAIVEIGSGEYRFASVR